MAARRSDWSDGRTLVRSAPPTDRCDADCLSLHRLVCALGELGEFGQEGFAELSATEHVCGDFQAGIQDLGHPGSRSLSSLNSLEP